METNKSASLSERNLKILQRWLTVQCHQVVANEFGLSEKTAGDIIRAYCRSLARMTDDVKRVQVPSLGLVFPDYKNPKTKYQHIPDDLAVQLKQTKLYQRLRGSA